MNSKQLLLYVSLVFVLIIGGCGGGGSDDLVGSLALTATVVNDTGGRYHAEATSTYSHPSKDVLGSEITMAFTTYYYDTLNQPQVLDSGSGTFKVSSSGAVTAIFPSVLQRSVPIFVDITARIGDLQQFARVTIPPLAPFTVSPTFINFSSPGTQTATISGSVAPYSVYSSPSGVITQVTNTSTLTVTISTFQNLNGSIIIQSLNDELTTLSINY